MAHLTFLHPVLAASALWCSEAVIRRLAPSGAGGLQLADLTSDVSCLDTFPAGHASMPCLGQPRHRDHSPHTAVWQGAEGAISLHRYDGQTFVKPPEVLARDRLLGTYEVKPTLERLKATLLGAAGGLLTSAVLLLGSFAAEADASALPGQSAGS